MDKCFVMQPFDGGDFDSRYEDVIAPAMMVQENREKYSGQWVALDGDRLIANGPTAKEVYSKAKAEGVEIPFVELVTEEESGPFTGGWLS